MHAITAAPSCGILLVLIGAPDSEVSALSVVTRQGQRPRGVTRSLCLPLSADGWDNDIAVV